MENPPETTSNDDDFNYPDPRNQDLHDLYLQYERKEINFALKWTMDPVSRKALKCTCRIRDKKQFWIWFDSLPASHQARLESLWQRGFNTGTDDEEDIYLDF